MDRGVGQDVHSVIATLAKGHENIYVDWEADDWTIYIPQCLRRNEDLQGP
jgi:hypothetical protein